MTTIRQLRRYFLFIIICLVIFFNIERLDFGQENSINFQSEIYVLGFTVVVLTLYIPSLYRSPTPVLLVFWAAIYLLIKFLPITDRPLLGGLYSYITITELAFVLMLVFLSQRLAQILREYVATAESLSIVGIDASVPDLLEVDERIQSEINRSRHLGRPMSVALVQANVNSTQIELPLLLAEVQASFIQRYLNAKVAQIIKRELRRMDILATDHKSGCLVVINPETNAQTSSQILRRIQAAICSELGIETNLGIATFPDQAYSFNDLFEIAQKEINRSHLMADLVTPKYTG